MVSLLRVPWPLVLFLCIIRQITQTNLTEYFGRTPKISFTGVFVILGRKVYDCQHGVDKKIGEKRKRKEVQEARNHFFADLYIAFIRLA